ncbi:ABC transporter permease [Pseudonocardia sp. D17]|uniref:ABC transporter permease n=1 Tax=Pseudonocardia sp. D17 TaxID=882661 RepID=UPI0030CD49A5|nr:ABC transporter [Pseudonocardia sp. D17]
MGVLLTSEVRRVLRSPRFLIFTVGFPVVYFLLFSGLYATGADATAVTVVLMLNMAAFGAISASISTGGRVAVERAVGWNRQLRLTPLPGWAYLAVKAAVAMLVALPALVLTFLVAVVVKHVDLTAVEWVRVGAAAWLGVLPFAAIGLLVGMSATQDSAQGMSTVTMLLFSLLGGVLIPASILPSALATVAHALPSYWLAEIARGQATGEAVPLQGMAVMLAWLVVAGGLVAVRYRRDALRV